MSSEEFEKWAESKSLITKHGHGGLEGYVQMGTGFALWGWQARQPEIDALKAENRGLADLFQKQVDASNDRKVHDHREIQRLQAEVEKLKADAERFRWLCEDHDSKETRDRRNRILECFSVHSYSASCMDIDAAIKETKCQ